MTEYETKEIVLTAKEKEIIEQDLKQYFKMQYSMKRGENAFLCVIQARFYVGLIKVTDNLQFVLQPKIPTANFLAMLAFIDSKYARIYQDLVEGLQSEKNFFLLFIESFLRKTEALLLRNRRKAYSRQITIEDVPRGKINALKSLPLQRRAIPMFWIDEFQFTEDTPHNQVIKFTLDFIKNSIPVQFFPLFRRVMRYLHDTSVRPWYIAEIDRLPYDRLTFDYKTIHTLCIMILEDFAVKFEKGDKSFFSFVLNTWNVYEIFLRRIFEKYQTKYQVDAYKIPNLAHDTDWDQKGRPDIVLQSKEEKIIIIDAKYKLSFQKTDQNQIYVYLGESKARYGYLIYPKSEKTFEKQPVWKQQQDKKVCIQYKLIDLAKIDNPDYLYRFVQSFCNPERT